MTQLPLELSKLIGKEVVVEVKDSLSPKGKLIYIDAIWIAIETESSIQYIPISAVRRIIVGKENL